MPTLLLRSPNSSIFVAVTVGDGEIFVIAACPKVLMTSFLLFVPYINQTTREKGVRKMI